MAAGNQGQGRRNEGHGQDRGRQSNGGAGRSPGAASSYGPDVQQTLSEGADRFREGYEAAREELAHRYRRAEGMMARNPGNSVLVAFGLGFGIGLAVTAMLARREETWADRYLPDSLRDLPDQIRKSRIPEHVGKAVRDAQVPESLHSTFSHLAEAIRDLPHTISKAVGR